MTPDLGAEQRADAARTGGPEGGFAALLRACRRAAGLTQADLAGRARIGVRTVRDLERGRASRPQRTTVELLADALELAGEARVDFLTAARGARAGQEDEPAPVGLPPTAALPPVGELVGRAHDVAELTDLLAATPGVVSLVGLAGVGKSSLALTVAHRLAPRFPAGAAGIVVIDIATEADLLASTASVFGVGRAAELPTRLAGGPALLLVDAVERAPAAVQGAVHRLVEAAPALRVIATGRQPTGLPGERVWPVTPLEVPPADVPLDLAAVSRYPAAELLLARLRLVRRQPVEPAEAGALVGLARRLAGLPLALELAAARGRVLDLNEILDRYGHRVLDLGPGPAGDPVLSLREAVGGSYQLLTPIEQYALRRLATFRNRWSVELAEAMLTDPEDPTGGPAAGDPVPLLDRLMALGLVSVRGSGEYRFRLIDMVRDFALEQATAAGELGRARRRHAAVLAAFAARTAPELGGASSAAAVERLDHVASDLLAALTHAAEADPPTALNLAASLPRWWRYRGRVTPGRRWLRRLLDDPRTAAVDPALRAQARGALALLEADQAGLPGRLAKQPRGRPVGDSAARRPSTLP